MPEIFIWNCDQSRVEDVFGPVMFKLEGSFLGWNILYKKENGVSKTLYITCSNIANEMLDDNFPKKFVMVASNMTTEEISVMFEDEEEDIEVIEVEEEFHDYFKDWFLDFITSHFHLLRSHLVDSEEENEEFEAEEKKVDALLEKYMYLLAPLDTSEEKSHSFTSSKLISPKSRELLESIKHTLMLAVEGIETPEAINVLLKCTKLLAPFHNDEI
jgi:hypothetical protein